MNIIFHQVIPLTDVLKTPDSKSRDQLTHRRVIMEQSARRNQRRAQIMLSRKGQSVLLPKQDAQCYVENQSGIHPTTSVKTAATNKSQHMFVMNLNPRVKEKLPRFLTESGDLVSMSLEEVGENLFHKLSRSSKKHGTQGSTFLTDLHHVKEDNCGEEHKCEGKTPLRKLSRWHPLSCSALTEYQVQLQ